MTDFTNLPLVTSEAVATYPTVLDLPKAGTAVEGSLAYVSDDETLYTFNGTNWAAVAGGGSGAVDSVNGAVGVVVLDTDDINEGTAQYFTNARVDSRLTTPGPIGGTTPNAGTFTTLTATGAFRLANMDTAARDALVALPGMVIFNTDTDALEYYNGTTWV